MYDLLSGLRVIEGSAFVAAPTGGMTLASLGADVIRFDAIGGGIDARRWPLTAGGRSLYWASLNKGKRSIMVDVRADEGRELVAAMIAAPGDGGGLFLTNMPARGPLAYERLAARRADVVMLQITGHPDGRTAVDYTVNSAVGFPLVTGPARPDAPVNHVIAAWDLLAGQHAVIGLLAAERHRQLTGEGRHVRLALSDVAYATVGHMGHIAEAQILGTQRARLGNDVYGAFGRNFATADDRQFMVVAISSRQWRALVAATGTAEAMAHVEALLGVDLGDEGERFGARDVVAAVIARWAGAHTLAEIATAFDREGVCWGPYQDFVQMVAEDPRCSVANPMFEEIDQPGIGRVLAPGSPLDFQGLDRVPVRPAPRLGEHTDEILAEVLGLASGDIGRLHDSGVVAGVEGFD